MKVKIKKLNNNAIIPKYQSKGAAGFDFHSSDTVRLNPGETKLVPTGLSFDIPEGYEMQVRPRSSLSLKSSLRITNSPGTIDSDYTGEVMLLVQNIASHTSINDGVYLINKGDRIAQGVVQKVEQAEFEVVEKLKETERGSGGFGSTDD